MGAIASCDLLQADSEKSKILPNKICCTVCFKICITETGS
jgi:hypothetical protein